ncbi:MAG: hypothetical protein ACHQT8_05960 [Chlamydiales bacterium]
MLSHLSILQDAFDSGYETIWVMEDDIEVVRNPTFSPTSSISLTNWLEKMDGIFYSQILTRKDEMGSMSPV